MKYMKWIVGISIGAILGFSYWYFIGCTSNTCPITSSPTISSIYGAVMGVLLMNTLTGKPSKGDG